MGRVPDRQAVSFTRVPRVPDVSSGREPVRSFTGASRVWDCRLVSMARASCAMPDCRTYAAAAELPVVLTSKLSLLLRNLRDAFRKFVESTNRNYLRNQVCQTFGRSCVGAFRTAVPPKRNRFATKASFRSRFLRAFIRPCRPPFTTYRTQRVRTSRW